MLLPTDMPILNFAISRAALILLASRTEEEPYVALRWLPWCGELIPVFLDPVCECTNDACLSPSCVLFGQVGS